MASITMTGFSVDADGDVVTKSIDNTNGGITNTGAIAGATTITASGAIQGGSLTESLMADQVLSSNDKMLYEMFVGVQGLYFP